MWPTSHPARPSDIFLKTSGDRAGMRLPPKPHGQPLRLDFTQEDTDADLVFGAIEGDPEAARPPRVRFPVFSRGGEHPLPRNRQMIETLPHSDVLAVRPRRYVAPHSRLTQKHTGRFRRQGMKLDRALGARSSHPWRLRFFPRDIGEHRPGQGFIQMNLRFYLDTLLDTQLILEIIGQRTLERLDLVGHVGTDPDLERAPAFLVALAAA